jgi:hypothetical protein
MNFKQIIFLVGLTLAGFNLFAASQPTEQIVEMYNKAVQDASFAQKGEIARDLIAITPSNSNLVWNTDQTKVLVVTWKSTESYEQFIKNETRTSTGEAYVIWVTTAPEVRNFCHRYIQNNAGATPDAVNLRLKQFLGLDASWNYDLFIEMWVSPQDIFRPCVDPEVTDSQCNLDFGSPPPVVTGISDYPSFYKNLYFNDFRNVTKVPWTGLGYTFDWGSLLTDQGASEFILVPGTTYQIKQAVPTMDYCNKIGN